MSDQNKPAAPAKPARPAESALVRELRSRGHGPVADKQARLDALHAQLVPNADGHRPLTDDELRIQADNALTVQEHRLAQQIEHGTYTATQDIYNGAALAYAAGHPVPLSNVERHGYDKMGLVARTASTAGEGSDA